VPRQRQGHPARYRRAEGAKGNWRIHTFIATSALHMEKKLRMSPDQVFGRRSSRCAFAKSACPDVGVPPRTSRSDPEFLCRVLEAVIKEGATTINIPDTVRLRPVPKQFGESSRDCEKEFPTRTRPSVGALPHDLGMAVANSLAAVMIGGARQSSAPSTPGERAATPRSRKS